ncbi:MAG: hypothetical protein V4542_01640 [Pseudomonadota bacterium]
MQAKQHQSKPATAASALPNTPESARRVDISHFDMLPDAAMISVKALATVVSKGVSTVWRNCQQDPDFPKPVRLGPGCTRFKVGDIREYLSAKASVPANTTRAQRSKGKVAI